MFFKQNHAIKNKKSLPKNTIVSSDNFAIPFLSPDFITSLIVRGNLTEADDTSAFETCSS